MKLFTLLVFLLLLIGTACKTPETSSNMPSVPTTVAQFIDKNPESAENFTWIDEDDYRNTWVMVDEFPRIINGMRDLQDRISRTVRNNPSEDCDQIKGERVLYQFVINEQGLISNLKSNLEEPNSCSDLMEITIRSTQYTSGKVNGEPVRVVFGLPVKF